MGRSRNITSVAKRVTLGHSVCPPPTREGNGTLTSYDGTRTKIREEVSCTNTNNTDSKYLSRVENC